MDPLQSLFTAASAFASVAALGAVKKYTGLADTAIGKAIKPIQPIIALVGAIGIPFLAGKLGIDAAIDPNLFVAAPTSTLVAIAAAEVQKRLFKGA